MGPQSVSGVEWIVPAPVAGKHVLVDPLIAGIDPAFYRPGIHVWRETKRFISRLSPSRPIRIRALQVRIEHPFVLPQAIEKRPGLG